ncbi:MAG: PhoH family protein [Bacteroidota bacterium]|nr:PhoH family protein [Bacteroidota bacterium]
MNKNETAHILKEIEKNIGNIDPLEFFGINDKNLDLIKKFEKEIKITARGNIIKISGNEKEVDLFEKKLDQLIDYADKHQIINEKVIKEVMTENSPEFRVEDSSDNFILYGRDKKIIKARTETQYKLIKEIIKNDIVFAVGPAGTGKTYTAVALAVKALKNKTVKRIILTRPAVEAGENLGFLPGDLREKVDPYLRPLYDALDDMLSEEKVKTYIERRIIEIAPLAFMRGRTLDDAFVILDEAQNCSQMQLKMFLTRMGPTAKFVVTGDLTQIDLPKSQKSGLLHAIQLLKNVKRISVLEFDIKDVTRHKIVKDIINAYSKEKEK